MKTKFSQTCSLLLSLCSPDQPPPQPPKAPPSTPTVWLVLNTPELRTLGGGRSTTFSSITTVLLLLLAAAAPATMASSATPLRPLKSFQGPKIFKRTLNPIKQNPEPLKGKKLRLPFQAMTNYMPKSCSLKLGFSAGRTVRVAQAKFLCKKKAEKRTCWRAANGSGKRLANQRRH